jgi:hypothetical protein
MPPGMKVKGCSLAGIKINPEGDNLLLFTSLVEEALTRLSDSSSTPDRCRESSAEV